MVLTDLGLGLPYAGLMAHGSQPSTLAPVPPAAAPATWNQPVSEAWVFAGGSSLSFLTKPPPAQASLGSSSGQRVLGAQMARTRQPSLPSLPPFPL